MSDGIKPKLQRFGRYLILDHLVDGGMAKICRARFLGEQVDKVVIIKMVQPQFSNDESFRTMFMDEIKVTYGLLHPNIVQTYDYGIHDGQLFVAMEYCDGRNLKEYFDKLRKRKFVFPVEISVYIMTQVCQGLHYAHTFADKLTGEEAKIVHRDISPHNIMLTYDGSVKVIDFGIAKSETNSEATQAGTIKGKLSYLAPEYLDGLDLDPRYDEFATGITLWEMLCSRKLFKAPNDLAVLKKIQECKIPAPSSINPNVPKELDDIILKALSKDRNKRYENLDQLNRALIKFLYSTYPDFNSSDLSYFAKELFKDEITKDKEKLYSFGRIDVAPYLQDLSDENGSSTQGSNDKISVSAVDEKKESEFDFGYDKNEKQTLIKPKSQNIVNGMESSEGLTVERKIKVGRDNSATRVTDYKKQKKNSSTSSGTKIKKQKSGLLFKVAAILIVFTFGYMKFGDKIFGNNPSNKITNSEDNSDFSNDEFEEISDKRVPTSTDVDSTDDGFMDDAKDVNFKLVRLKNVDKHNPNMNVYLNGKIEKLDYLGRLKVPVGRTVNIRVEEAGRVPYTVAYDVENDPKREITVNIGGSIRYGFLYTSEDCNSLDDGEVGELTFTLWDEPRTIKVPIVPSEGYQLPGVYAEASGRTGDREYVMVYVRQGEKTKNKIKFSLKINGRVDFCSLVP